MHSKIDTSITLRQAQPEDRGFLFAVYASTRAEEMALLPWSEAEKNAFLSSQFRAQYEFYTQNYQDAQFQVILLGDQPIGRLYVHRQKDEIRIMDIALLPEYRNRNIGSTLLQELLAEAEESNLPVSIHVERFNPALHLYERLGFCLAEDMGVYLFMKWSPTTMEHAYSG